MDAKRSRLDQFAEAVVSHRCWFGSLEWVRSYDDLRIAIDERIYSYRNFLNYNSELPESIMSSKTSAGEPIGMVARALKQSGVIPDEMPVLVVIDQFEDLMGLEVSESENTGTAIRGVVMKMLSERGQQVSYRIGARPYSLYPDFTAFRAGSPAEEMRNFKIIDIGDVLRSKEARPGLFKDFCEDVFRRRLNCEDGASGSPLSTVFGRNETPKVKAHRYVKTNPSNVIGSRDALADEDMAVLADIATRDPLSARLGAAWVLQQRARKGVSVAAEDLVDEPWNHWSRRWWKKERSQQALLQIAASQQQRMKWYGPRDILALSGGNILVFLSICQFIWAEYRRSVKAADHANPPKGISDITQDVGIHEASSYWFRKVKADPSGGDDRHRFVSVLGTKLRTALREDRRMSYPGETGFSLSEKELEANKDVSVFLNRCVAYGVLESFRHTAKSKHRGQSRKWYLFPILTPYFQLPTRRTKEPKYLRVSKLREWLQSANVRGVCWAEYSHHKNRGGDAALARQSDLFSDDP